jgi:hypothetical protein
VNVAATVVADVKLIGLDVYNLENYGPARAFLALDPQKNLCSACVPSAALKGV